MPPNLAYSAMMLLSLLVGAILLRRWQSGLSLLWWQKLGIGFGAFCGAFLGAKLPFALYDWANTNVANPWLGDGKTIMFGVVGGYLGVEVAKWSLEIRQRTGDSYAVPVAVAVALGRLACFIGGCCFGTPTTLPWGVVFTAQGPLPRHPTQLYEFAFHITAAALLWYFHSRGWFRYQLIKLYILSYLVFRFVTEFIRPEPEFYGLSAYQWIALALFPIFIGLWVQTDWQVRKENVLSNVTEKPPHGA
ncbi:Prolipoprotein diacylglyceryl transferase [Anatilimnocola aggregata]|uniref:Prolipoprotein diacylglyceryl transferase n=1 Tax=Anatilimnocola aggregata TaxID=2528021 RepID=A0A517YK41_9BACT|nr:prolipoprotein diacylglyceryl transferase family protein [Anatilimnocola aggregata]QDU30582.1 Prolipoprotein diacylglyceryl transferase [Anatilimnocola aggregata]